MEGILSRLLQPDSEVIKAATAELRAAFKQPGVIPQLCAVLAGSPQAQIRQYAAVLLRCVYWCTTVPELLGWYFGAATIP